MQAQSRAGRDCSFTLGAPRGLLTELPNFRAFQKTRCSRWRHSPGSPKSQSRRHLKLLAKAGSGSRDCDRIMTGKSREGKWVFCLGPLLLDSLQLSGNDYSLKWTWPFLERQVRPNFLQVRWVALPPTLHFLLCSSVPKSSLYKILNI